MLLLDIKAFSPRRPLFGPAAAALIGAALGQRHPDILYFAFLSAVSILLWLALLAAGKRTKRDLSSLGSLVFLTAVAGAAAFSAAEAQSRKTRDRESLQLLAENKARLVVAGEIATDPHGGLMRRGGAWLSFRLDTHRVSSDGGRTWNRLRMPLEITIYGPASLVGDNPPRPLPAPGEGWLLDGGLRAPYRETMPFKLNVSFRPGTPVRKTAFDAPAWKRGMLSLKREAARRLTLGIEDRPQAIMVLHAMLLGYQSRLPYELRNIFANSGTIHIFAISGLHVAILASLITAVLPITRLQRQHWFWAMIPLLIGYTFLTGGRPSAMRACVMSILFFCAPGFSRRSDPLSSLAAAAILILAIAPLQIGDLGFIFSFTCVLGLLSLTPALETLMGPRPEQPQPDDWYKPSAKIAIPSWISRPSKWVYRKVLQSLAVSIAVWLVSTPITAYFFGRVTPGSLIGNLYAIPFAFGVVMSGLISLIASLVSLWLSAYFNSAAALIIEILVRLTELTVRIPGASFEVRRWNMTEVVLWYLGCLIVGLLLHTMARRRGERLAARHIPQ